MQREERETERAVRSIRARTGLPLEGSPQSTKGGAVDTFYSQPGTVGGPASKGATPVHLLSMQTGAGVKKTKGAGSTGSVLGAIMVPRAVKRGAAMTTTVAAAERDTGGASPEVREGSADSENEGAKPGGSVLQGTSQQAAAGPGGEPAEEGEEVVLRRFTKPTTLRQ